MGNNNCWVLAEFYEKEADNYEEKRFINLLSNLNYHFISYRIINFMHKKIVPNLTD